MSAEIAGMCFDGNPPLTEARFLTWDENAAGQVDHSEATTWQSSRKKLLPGQQRNFVLYLFESPRISVDELLLTDLERRMYYSSRQKPPSMEQTIFLKIVRDDGKELLLNSVYFTPGSLPVLRSRMEVFAKAKVVRLRGHNGKYLHADEDEESVTQTIKGSSKSCRWTVEFGHGNTMRLKSCFGKYLTASGESVALRPTALKVLQTLPSQLDSSLDWEPIREGNHVRLKTRQGKFLRSNDKFWVYGVTHGIPKRTFTQNEIVWEVDVLEILVSSPAPKPPPELILHSDSFASSSESSSPSSNSTTSTSFSNQESGDSLDSSSPKRVDGRRIYYSVADEYGEVDEDVDVEWLLFITFKGNEVDDLTRKLEEETGLEDVVVCSRSPLDGKLCPLLLQLPPKNSTMKVFVVHKGELCFEFMGILVLFFGHESIGKKGMHSSHCLEGLTVPCSVHSASGLSCACWECRPSTISMDFFTKTGAVKLRSHLDKYLVADDDNKQTVRQSRNGSLRKSRWLVELVENKPHVIRLKSFHGGYLTASVHPFLLGMTGNRVLHTTPYTMKDQSIEWEPIRDGFQVKLRAFGGTYLRANGGPLPWRNSVTHDDCESSSPRHNWVLWDVEGAESPLAISRPTMDLFANAKAVRLRGHHRKYLHAEEDEETVTQDRNGSSKKARWTVEFVEGGPDSNIIRLKSCFNKYLTASNQHFLFGMTGQKVLQTLPRRLDSSVEWEPVREGGLVKLRTRYGQFLRANGGLPPWRNSVTHDIPQRTATQEWILWQVDVVEIVVRSPAPGPPPKLVAVRSDSFATSESSSPSTHSTKSTSFSRQESGDSLVSSPPKRVDGRIIYYHVADEYGEVDEDVEGDSITFKGSGVDELTRKLEEETGLQDIVVCSRSPLNGKLYPLRLQLPPNNVTMNVVVVQNGELLL
ncbi:hypothetical protein RJ639_041480 [Escallonia herrerae]|uniref:Actin cross-linking n=1 Tax=Escallonia herrerae TaxID=1293975 RepID=A0AA88WH94_9ASTE|nr:hypothetical protein RJ639_041480 [Escallonia herrerae]